MKNLILSLFFFTVSLSFFSQTLNPILTYTIEKKDLFKIKKNKLKKTNHNLSILIDDDYFSLTRDNELHVYIGKVSNKKLIGDTTIYYLESTLKNLNLNLCLTICNNNIKIIGTIDKSYVEYFSNIYSKESIDFSLN
jgi:hypothetical protein